MKKSKLSPFKGKYKQQLLEARLKYLKKTGLKIARGFSDTDEFKRIRKNSRQASYRKRKRALLLDAEKAIIKEIRDNVEIDGEEGLSFHSVLSHGQKIQRKVANLFETYKSIEGENNVHLYIIDPEGSKKTYTNRYQADLALMRLYQKGLEIQKETNDSFGAIVDYATVEGSRGIHITVKMYEAGE